MLLVQSGERWRFPLVRLQAVAEVWMPTSAQHKRVFMVQVRRCVLVLVDMLSVIAC